MLQQQWRGQAITHGEAVVMWQLAVQLHVLGAEVRQHAVRCERHSTAFCAEYLVRSGGRQVAMWIGNGKVML